MTQEELNEIKARAEAATPGPWETYKDYIFSAFDRYGISTYFEWPVCKAGGDLTAQNADFIAHARADVPALVAEVERLRATVADNIDVMRRTSNEIDQYQAEIERLRRLEDAVKRGVEQVLRLNSQKGQLDYMAQRDARQKMDAAWGDMLVELSDAEAAR